MNLDHILDVSRSARRMGDDFPGYLSTGEALTAALVLNRADWLRKMDYTMAEAIQRIDTSSLSRLQDAQRQLQNEAPLVEA